MKSVLVRGEPFYNFETGEPKSMCKRGKNFTMTNIPDIPKGVIIKPSKITDVKRLLVLHYGEQWDSNPKLKFYHDVFVDQETDPQCVDEEMDEADPMDFDLMEDDVMEIV